MSSNSQMLVFCSGAEFLSPNLSLENELENRCRAFTSSTKCEIKRFTSSLFNDSKEMYKTGSCARMCKILFCWSKPVPFLAVLVVVAIILLWLPECPVPQYFGVGLLPDSLAPVK